MQSEVPWRNAEIVVRGDVALVVVNSVYGKPWVAGKIEGFTNLDESIPLDEYED